MTPPTLVFVGGRPICADCLNGKHEHDRDCKNTGPKPDGSGDIVQCHCGFGGRIAAGQWVPSKDDES